MKINAIRLLNLNSLKGEFFIDFDRPPFSDAGLFAITGPTGAGKTTILDAVCVALYGQTPRLAPGASDQLMTRHTAECFAEVEFTVPQGRYRSRWSQRRARGRADGRVQPVAMELVSLTGRKARIIEEKKSRVVQAVARITGLDFPRFTRSVLLAQGGFAAFLEARDNDRADLLEKMTGTAIYSTISSEVYQRTMAEKKRLDELVLLRESFTLMEPEEIAGLKERAAELDARITETGKKLAELDTQGKWLLEVAELEQTVKEGLQELARADREWQAARSDLARLGRSREALPLAGDFTVLADRRRQLAVKTTELTGLADLLASLAGEFEKTAERKTAEEARRQDFLVMAEKRRKIIAETEARDQRIAAGQDDLAGHRKLLDQAGRDLDRLTGQKRQTCREIDAIQEKIARCNDFLASHRQDQSLASELSLLEEKLQSLAEKRQQHDTMLNQRREAETRAADLEQRWRAAAKKLQDLDQSLQQDTARKTGLENELAASLAGRSPAQVEGELKEAEKRVGALTTLLALGEKIAAGRGRKQKTCAARERAARDLADCRGQRAALEAEHRSGREILAELEEKQTLELLVAKYEEDRLRLRPDAPCPLCGSTDHPWAVEKPPEAGKAEAILNNQRQKLLQIQDAITAVSGRIIELETRISHYDQEQNQLDRDLGRLLAEWSRAIEPAAVAGRPEEWSHLEPGRREAETTLQEKTELLNTIKSQQESLAALKDRLLEQGREISSARETVTTTESAWHRQAELAKRLGDDLGRLQKELTGLEQFLAERLRQYETPLPPPGLEPETARELQARYHRLDETGSQLAELHQALKPLEEKRLRLEVELEGLVGRQSEEEREVRALEGALLALREERFGLLGENRPDEERRRLEDTRAGFENRLRELETRTTALRSELTLKEEQRRKTATEVEALCREIDKLEAEFRPRLEQAGFAAEEDLRRALLPKEEFSRLEGLEKELTKHRTRARVRLRDAEQKLKSRRENPLTDEPLETIRKKGEELKARLAGDQEALGAVKEKLNRQETLREQQREKAAAARRQREEYERWSRLNALIGSADGKKFRRFAQGLTLDYLIHLANRHLGRLNDRYILKRDSEEELGLEVVDTFQADISRPTSTLSGGESFLVSLALALGLSGLAGRQTSIDSLFLDEGFGTLDQETLETALAALDSLNAAGKMIGIISHVEALKERIPVRIQVDKLAGGVSTLRVF